MLALAGILALVGTRYIERPIRYSVLLNASAWKGIAVGVAGILLSLSVSGLAGFTSRTAAAEGGPAAAPQIVLFGRDPQPIIVPSNLNPTLADASSARRSALARFGGCFQSVAGMSPLPSGGCLFGDVTSSKVVAVLGDSHAAHWLPALTALGLEHNFAIFMAVKAGCSSVGGLVAREPNDSNLKSCQAFHEQAIAHIRQSRITTVILASSAGYLWRDSVSREYLQKLEALIQQLQSVGTSSIVLGDSPTFKQDIPTCLSISRTISSCSQRVATQEAKDLPIREQNAVESVGGRYLATAPLLCPVDVCPLIAGNLLIYLDTNHLAPDFSAWFAPILGKVLLPLLSLDAPYPASP